MNEFNNLEQVPPRSCAQLNYAGICNPGKSFYHTYLESSAVFNYSTLCTALINLLHIPQNMRRAQTVYCSLTWLRARCVKAHCWCILVYYTTVRS